MTLQASVSVVPFVYRFRWVFLGCKGFLGVVFCEPWLECLPPQLCFLRAVPASAAFSVVPMAVWRRFGLIFDAPGDDFVYVFGRVPPALRGFLWLTRALAMDSDTINFFGPRVNVSNHNSVSHVQPSFRKLLGNCSFSKLFFGFPLCSPV